MIDPKKHPGRWTEQNFIEARRGEDVTKKGVASRVKRGRQVM